MSSYPTVEEIQKTYQAVYEFLDLMHAAIAETKQAEKFEELFDLSDRLDSILSELEAPFEGLERLRALAEHMRGTSIGDKVDSWAVSAVKMFGDSTVDWIRSTADYIRDQEPATAEDNELSSGYGARPSLPVDMAYVDLCRTYLRQEEAGLVATASNILNEGSQVPPQIIVPTQIDVATQVNAPIDVNVGPCMSNAVVNEAEASGSGSSSPVLNTEHTESVEPKRKSINLSNEKLREQLKEAEIFERWQKFQGSRSSKKRDQTREFINLNIDLVGTCDPDDFRLLIKRVKGRKKNTPHALREEAKTRGLV